MNGFDNRPNPEELRERLAKLRRVKEDLRGVGWTMLASELIHTWLAVLVMGLLVAQRIAPQLSGLMAGASSMEDIFAKAASAVAELTGTDWYANVVVVLTVAAALLGVLPAHVYARRRDLTLRPALGLNGLGAKDVAVMYAAMMGVNTLGMLGVMATELLFNASGFTIFIDIMPDDTALSFWLMNAYAVLLAPLVEEYVYRGVLLEGMKPYGERFAVTASAVLFGLTHGNLMQFLPAVLIGWFLGYIRMKTGSWGVCVLLHALNNVTSLLLDELLERVPNETVYAALNYAYIGVTLVAVAVAWRAIRKRGELQEAQEPVGFGALVSAPSLIYLYLVFETMITSVSRVA